MDEECECFVISLIHGKHLGHIWDIWETCGLSVKHMTPSGLFGLDLETYRLYGLPSGKGLCYLRKILETSGAHGQNLM